MQIALLEKIKNWAHAGERLRVLRIIGIGTICVSLGANIYLGFEHKRLTGDLNVANGMKDYYSDALAEERTKNNDLAHTVNDREFTLSLASITFDSLNDNMAKLDEATRKENENTKKFMNWLIDNGVFFGDDIAASNAKYGTWWAVNDQAIDDYNEAMNNLNSLTKELRGSLNY